VSKTVYLSMGSNVGDRVENLKQAIAKLPATGASVTRTSSFYETEPVDFLQQDWFVHCAVEAETGLAPLDLLRAVRAIEARMGSKKPVPKGPRLLDIDVLLYADEIVQTAELQIPHPRMQQRRFVLVPLNEIAPRVLHPQIELTVSELLARCQDAAEVRLLTPK
jgi:2-amino-4-hydroxy-6-hydroxymethyldihydropteridine diphosphokinase